MSPSWYMYVLSEFHCVIIGLAVLKKCCQCNNKKIIINLAFNLHMLNDM